MSCEASTLHRHSVTIQYPKTPLLEAILVISVVPTPGGAERVTNLDISVSGTMTTTSRLKQHHHALLKTRHCLIYPRRRREIVSFANRQHAMARIDRIFACITGSSSVQNSIFPFLDEPLQCGGRMYEFTPHYR